MNSDPSESISGVYENRANLDAAQLEKADTKDVSTDELMTGGKLALVFTAFMLAFSLVALDRTIVATALPTIASKFHSVSDLSWIASGYFLPQATFMLFFGAVLRVGPPKAIFITSIAIFELGSLFCGVAPSVNFLIFGRAVAGFGGAGLWISVMTIVARTTTLKQRPIFMGLIGGVFAISSVIGPIVGGLLSDHVSWRWCFYINLPIGGVALATVILALPNLPAPQVTGHRWQRIKSIDWFGTFLSFAMILSLLLPLQWGGNTRPWRAPEVITLLVLSFVFLVAFIAIEIRQGSKAILPLQILCRRTMLGAFVTTFFVQLSFILCNFYLPLLYQLNGHSATRSGVDVLPFMASGVFASMLAGGIISKLGHPWPFLIIGPAVASIGFGLLFTVDMATRGGKIAGFQILVGFGLGSAIQNTLVVAQAEFADEAELVPQATSLITFMQLIGSAIGLAVFGAIFADRLQSQLAAFGDILPASVVHTVLSDIQSINGLTASQKAIVIPAYITAVDDVFLAGVVACALASLAALVTCACVPKKSHAIKESEM